MLVMIDDGEVTNQLVDKRVFLSSLLESADRFYSLLTFYFDGIVNYEYELEQINSLKSMLPELTKD